MTVNFAYVPDDDGGCCCVDGDRLSLAYFECTSTQSLKISSTVIETNHTSRFWNIVRANAPTMDKAKTWLREHGQVLKVEV
jgi:hypothetical protein